MSSAVYALSLAAVVSAVLAMLVRTLQPQRLALFYILKPLTTCLILAVAVVPAAHAWSSYNVAIVVGLLFSIAGDIWIMLPDRLIVGLAGFLLALLSYIFAFAGGAGTDGVALLVAPPMLVGALMLWYLWPGLSSGLRGPVSIYVLAMVAMTSTAAYRASATHSAAALAAAIGAVLFLISDAVLAIDRFRRPFARS